MPKMKTISNLIYYSFIALYVLFFASGFIIIFNSILMFDARSISFIVGAAMMVLVFMLLAIIIFTFILGLINFNLFTTKKQIEDYLTDKFNQRKLPF
jgi:hypothetical protein